MENNIWHIEPINDEADHLISTEQGGIILIDGDIRTGVYCRCGCDPKIEYRDGQVVVIHNSFDGREGLEMANEILKA